MLKTPPKRLEGLLRNIMCTFGIGLRVPRSIGLVGQLVIKKIITYYVYMCGCIALFHATALEFEL